MLIRSFPADQYVVRRESAERPLARRVSSDRARGASARVVLEAARVSQAVLPAEEQRPDVLC